VSATYPPGVRRRPAQALAAASSKRAKIAFYVAFALACFLGVRFYAVQVHDGPGLAQRAYDQRVETINLPAHRGTIFDRDLTPLVRSLPSQSVYVSTSDVLAAPSEAHALARILTDQSESDLLEALRGKSAYVQLEHKISSAQADAIAKLALPGISIVPEPTGVRFVPSGRFLSTVLGFTGFDENGLDGIEYGFDSVLRGTTGRMELEEDESGHAIPFAQPHVVVAAKPGHSLVLTIDSYLEYNVERILHETVAQWHAQSGSAIVMDPYTGEVLAMANVPDYDLHAYGSASPDSRRDRAIADAYEPGSTFKLITAAAALDSGKVTTTDTFPARDQLEIGGHVIHNAEDGFLAGTGSETLGEIIAKSHNVGAAEVALRIGRKTMYDMLRRFGIGDETGIGLPGENPGIVPPLADWSETSLPTIAFGHGIATTPLAMARAYCAIANGGLLLRPRILSEILDSDGAVSYEYKPEVVRRVMSEQTAATLRSYLRNVVLTGTGNPTAQVPGYTTAGKTGTAQVAENGVYSAGDYVGSFIGYVPAEVPKYVILVKIAKPRGAIYGGVVAAPAFAQIARIAMEHAGIAPVLPRSVPKPPAAK
jgi:stage V sporulation protein D (sporulation-specific penicillin-binding protein)